MMRFQVQYSTVFVIENDLGIRGEIVPEKLSKTQMGCETFCQTLDIRNPTQRVNHSISNGKSDLSRLVV